MKFIQRKWAELIHFWKVNDKYILVPILLSLSTSLAIIGLILFNYQRLPSRLPLLYSLPWGESQLVSKQQFILLPLMIVVLTLTNASIFWQLHNSQVVLKRTLGLNLVLVNALILITSLKILSIFL